MGIELQRVKEINCQIKLNFSNLTAGSGNYSSLSSKKFSITSVSTNCNYNSSVEEIHTSFPRNLLHANIEFESSAKETFLYNCKVLVSVTKAKIKGEFFALKAMKMVTDRLANSSLSNYKKDIPIAGKIYLFTRMKNLICW